MSSRGPSGSHGVIQSAGYMAASLGFFVPNASVQKPEPATLKKST